MEKTKIKEMAKKHLLKMFDCGGYTTFENDKLRILTEVWDDINKKGAYSIFYFGQKSPLMVSIDGTVDEITGEVIIYGY